MDKNEELTGVCWQVSYNEVLKFKFGLEHYSTLKIKLANAITARFATRPKKFKKTSSIATCLTVADTVAVHFRYLQLKVLRNCYVQACRLLAEARLVKVPSIEIKKSYFYSFQSI